MIDFTGGIVERIEFSEVASQDAQLNLFKVIRKALERGSLVGAFIVKDSTINYKRIGLNDGHAYSLTASSILEIKSKLYPILRIKNPHGNSHEWNGLFSDESLAWKLIPEKIQKEMDVKFEDDGEFFMTIFDFLEHFDGIEICHISFDVLVSNEAHKVWNLSSFESIGCESASCNPEIIINLTDPDEDDDDDFCTTVIALMLKNRRNLKGPRKVPLKFDMFELNDNQVKLNFLGSDFIESNDAVATCNLCDHGEVCVRLRLLPGFYVIKPQIKSSKKEEFILRIVTESPKVRAATSVIRKVNKCDAT